MSVPGIAASTSHITPGGQNSDGPWQLGMGQLTPTPHQDYEITTLKTGRGLFGSLQTPTLASQLVLQKPYPDLYHTQGNTPEPN